MPLSKYKVVEYAAWCDEKGCFSNTDYEALPRRLKNRGLAGAATYFRELGWKEKDGKWTCPKCQQLKNSDATTPTP